MQTLFIGFVSDTVDNAMKAIAIRIAYLFSARFRLAGNISTFYTFGKRHPDFSIEQKIKFIDDRFNEPDRIPIYDQYKEIKKIHKKFNGSQKKYIVAKKKFEISVEEMFSQVVNEIAYTIQRTGLTDLEPIEETPAYGEYYVSYYHPEEDADGFSKLSDLLVSNLDEDDNEHPTVFVITDLLFLSEFDPGNDEIPELNTFSHKGFLQELNTCPDYNVLTVADLNTLRFEVKEDIENFQIAVNTFATLHASPAEAFNYLQNDVLASAKKLAEGIDKTPLINNYRNMASDNSNVGSILLGMIPQSLLFKYFEFIKASSQDTIEIIQQIPEAESGKLVPVLVATLKTGADTEEMPAQEMTLRKTLSID